jgi:hypothetical protein
MLFVYACRVGQMQSSTSLPLAVRHQDLWGIIIVEFAGLLRGERLGHLLRAKGTRSNALIRHSLRKWKETQW